MKTIILTLVLLSTTMFAQTVQVSQEFLDDATKSFKEVRALREAMTAQETVIKAMAESLKAKDETISAKDEVIKAKDEKLAIKDETIETYKKMRCDKTSFFFGLIKNTRCH